MLCIFLSQSKKQENDIFFDCPYREYLQHGAYGLSSAGHGAEFAIPFDTIITGTTPIRNLQSLDACLQNLHANLVEIDGSWQSVQLIVPIQLDAAGYADNNHAVLSLKMVFALFQLLARLHLFLRNNFIGLDWRDIQILNSPLNVQTDLQTLTIVFHVNINFLRLQAIATNELIWPSENQELLPKSISYYQLSKKMEQE